MNALRRCLRNNALPIISAVLAVTMLTVSFYGGAWIFRLVKLRMYPIKFEEYVSYYSEQYDVPQSVVYAVIWVESDFRPDAVSRAGACGLMQLMPDTYTDISEKIGRIPDRILIFEPSVNIDCGVKLLSMLYKKYSDWNTVYAAYNAGETRVDKWLSEVRHNKDGMLVDIPITETAEYVRKVSEAVGEYHRLYGI